MAKSFPTHEWTFMNYGYEYNSSTEAPKLDDKDELNRFSIQLYHKLIHKVDHNQKLVLEVGSGRGGGAHYIATSLPVKEMIGMDLAESAVELSNKNLIIRTLSSVFCQPLWAFFHDQTILISSEVNTRLRSIAT